MKDYFKGWKDRKEIAIPEIRKQGFSEDVIIRNPVQPVRKQVPHSEDEQTVLLTPEMKYSAWIKRLKTGEEMRVSRDGLVIGKSSEADFVIHDNPTVSRKHARVTCSENGCFLEDLGSSNHVFADGRQITGPVRLTDHMIFRLSEDEEFEFTVRAGQ